MQKEAGGVSSRHKTTRDLRQARIDALQRLIDLEIVLVDGHRLRLVKKGKNGVKEIPVSVHTTKALLVLPDRVSIDPRSLIPSPRDGQ